DLEEGKALYHEGELCCSACSSDVRSILRAGSPPSPPDALGQAHVFLPFTLAPFPDASPAPALPEQVTATVPFGTVLPVASASAIRASVQLASFLCGACGKKVGAADLFADRAIRYEGTIYCGDCKKDFGRLSAPAAERAPVAAILPSVPCARCDRMIPPID